MLLARIAEIRMVPSNYISLNTYTIQETLSGYAPQ